MQITAGPLEGFMGLVEEIDTENFKVKLKVNMFGRETPQRWSSVRSSCRNQPAQIVYQGKTAVRFL